MATEVSPQKVQTAARNGRKRMSNFRAARLMFIRQFVGQYYDQSTGLIGTEPLNLIFNAIRVLVPNIVMNMPKHVVGSKFVAYRDYAELLELALSEIDKDLDIDDVYRRWIVDAIFTIGILKTGIADSGTVVAFDENDLIDNGQVFTETVDLDNFIIDPNCKNLSEAAFLGDVVCVPRRMLLESGLYNNELVERLPKAGYEYSDDDQAKDLSRGSLSPSDDDYLEDEVEIAELWVPGAKAIVTVPVCEGYTPDDFLRVADYHGPKEGPYTFLSLTPPVPNNPLPVSQVGIWYDLHIKANRMAKKIMEQAERQKDIVGYKRSAADDAQEALDAGDGEAIAMDDPTGIAVHSFGGQQTSNEAHMAQLQSWFNMMANNPQGIGGQDLKSDSATEANILQSNASIGLEDMKFLIYKAAAQEARKRAFYLHTDPLIELPLTKRVTIPPEMAMGPTGPMMVAPSRSEDVQVFLTPEARQGDFLDYNFTIEPESMGRMDPAKRMNQAMAFAVKIIPAAAQASQTCAMMGVPFSFSRFVIRMGKIAGITWMDEVFQDPEFQMQMMALMARSPQPQGSKGQAVPPGGGMSGIVQNGQPPGVGAVQTPQQEMRSGFQEGANAGQADLPVRSGY